MQLDSDISAVVLGAGPAGLAAAVACKENGLDVALFERGRDLPIRERNLAVDIATGVGGAGLFSDGKFSFYPSASRLWSLNPDHDLSASYSWLSELIPLYGVQAPELPTQSRSPSVEPSDSLRKPVFRRKPYPSFYMSLDARRRVIQHLRDLAGTVYTEREVVALGIDADVVRLTIRDHSVSTKSCIEIRAQHLIIATGRLGPLLLQPTLHPHHQIFRRLELGVRLEQPHECFFLRDDHNLDPKLISVDSDQGLEWRTFCCCRQGQVVEVLSDGVMSVSGRADVEPTGRSNVGFHLRIMEPEAASTIWRRLLPDLRSHPRSVSFPFKRVMADLPTPLADVVGPDLGERLLVGLKRFQTFLPDNALRESTIYAPAVEGVGIYPSVDSSLKLSGLPIWVAGDATGLFRGLTAALTSGYFVGRQVSRAHGLSL